jgi:hypothetical protein
MTNYEIIEQSIKYKLPATFKIQNLWPQFIEAVSEELSLQKTEDDKTKYIQDIYNLLESDLLTLAKQFGYLPNLILDNSLANFRQEMELISYRVKNKTTYNGYLLNFKKIYEYGNVYNLFFNGNKLVRALSYSKTIDLLNSPMDSTVPFAFIIDKNFVSVNEEITFTLDRGFILDGRPADPLALPPIEEIPIWYLDKNLLVSATKHLSIEYNPKEVKYDGLEKFLYNAVYFQYLLESTLYNKRVPIVPHCGAKVSFLFSENPYFNDLTLGDYTNTMIEGKASVVVPYYNKALAQEPINLDNGESLDPALTWVLDSVSPEENAFNPSEVGYISIGSGSKNLCNVQHKETLNLRPYIVIFTFDDLSRSVFKDYSINKNTLTLVGQYEAIQGNIGKTIFFSGSSYLLSTNPVNIVGESTFSLWVNPSNQPSGTSCILDQAMLKLDYAYDTELLTIGIGYVGLRVNDTIMIPKGQYSFLILEIIGNDLFVYLNANLVKTIDITGIPYTGQNTLYIGANSSLAQNYYGLVEQLWLRVDGFTSEEKTYIYLNKIGMTTHLSNPIARLPIWPDNEVYETDAWILIQSYCPLNFINDEYSFTKLVGIDSYLNMTKYNSIVKGSMRINFKKIVNFLEEDDFIVDDKAGSWDHDYISGNINYDTGSYEVILHRTKFEPLKTLVVGSASSVSYILVLTGSIVPESFVIRFTIQGIPYQVRSNPSGHFIYDSDDLGTIDHVSGQLTINHFPSNLTTDPDHNITCSYYYTNVLNMPDGNICYLEYRTDNKVRITELSIENKNKETMIYSTFPYVEASTYENHIAGEFAIAKI